LILIIIELSLLKLFVSIIMPPKTTPPKQTGKGKAPVRPTTTSMSTGLRSGSSSGLASTSTAISTRARRTKQIQEESEEELEEIEPQQHEAEETTVTVVLPEEADTEEEPATEEEPEEDVMELSEKRRAKTSMVWHFFKEMQIKATGEKVALCNLCAEGDK
jgi:hypothetical protein